MLESLTPRLSRELAQLITNLPKDDAASLEEIRVYCGRSVELAFEYGKRKTELVMQNEDIARLLSALSGFALYRFEREMAQGYMPLPGGHRAGICGRMIRQEDGSWRMGSVTSICLRIARHVNGASAAVRPHLFDGSGRVRRVLLLGAPGCGKTTVLRDAALYLCSHVHVAVADERGEISAPAQMQGRNIDVLSGMPKALACQMMIRTMRPQVILCDELGSEDDATAIKDAARCGAGVLATAHANGLEDLLGRVQLRCLFDAGVFERYIHLGRHGCVMAAWDGEGKQLEGKGRASCGKVGDCGDDDDLHQQRRISLVRR